ncbi:MAG: 50S ribosomal protein L4 [Candidatus Yanofskybacteria bacterium]|nr:50S ribosomal protein L4 [Candidatus Yanofskybacteria bacterium]
MQVDTYNQSGEIIGKTDLPEEVFGLKINSDLLSQVVTAQSANARQVIAHTKDRSEVRGGGKKPWRQKGTGRARHGSIRSPLWKGGGVTFGPGKNRNFTLKINKKMKRKALFMSLSGKVSDNQMLVLDNINIDQAKTKKAQEIFDTLSSKSSGYIKNKKKRDSILLILGSRDKNVERSAGNLSFVKTLDAKSLDVFSILSNKFVFLDKNAIPVIQETYKLKSK